MKVAFISLCIAVTVFVLANNAVVQVEWDRDPSNPVLKRGSSGAWDDTTISWPTVLFDGTKYKMWYTGMRRTSIYRIGLATSTDGITKWTKYNDPETTEPLFAESDPVLVVGSPGEWDDRNVFSPIVLFDGTEYKMYYTGTDDMPKVGGIARIGLATRTDGVKWTKYDDPETTKPPFAESDPVLDVGPDGAWDDSLLYPGGVHFDGVEYKMWYSGYDGSCFRIGLATSTDGIVWVKHGKVCELLPDETVVCNGLLGESWEWDYTYVWHPSVVFNVTEGKYEMWYSGGRAATGYRIGYATSTDGFVWKKYPDNPVFGPGQSESWDSFTVYEPTVLFDSTEHKYKMWYVGANANNVPSAIKIGYATSAIPDDTGPIVSDLQAAPNPVAVDDPVELTATVDDSTTGGSTIASAEYRIDEGSWLPMDAVDGALDEVSENVIAIIPGFSEPGTHAISVRGTDSAENVGEPEDISITVLEAAFGYALFGSTGKMAINEYASVSGDVYNRDEVEIKAGATINGLLYTTEPVKGGGSYTLGPLPDPLPELPALDITPYDNMLSDAASQPDGDVAFHNLDLAGETLLVNGKFVLENDGSITGPGMIVAIKGIEIKNRCSIGEDISLVSEKKVEIKEGTVFAPSIDNVLFSSEAIIVEKHTQVSGALLSMQFLCISEYSEFTGVAYSASGEVMVKEAASIEGCVLAYSLKEVEKYVTVTYDASTVGYIGKKVFMDAGGSAASPPVFPALVNGMSVKVMLSQNYPNPFNPDTWIPYHLAEDMDVSIRIYDVAGHLIRTLGLGRKPAGFYTTKEKAAYWDGKNEAGEQVASGMYFYTIQAGGFTATKKMIMAE